MVAVRRGDRTGRETAAVPHREELHFEIMKGGVIHGRVEPGKLRVEMTHGAGHTFTRPGSQARLLDLIAGWTRDRQLDRASLEPVGAG